MFAFNPVLVRNIPWNIRVVQIVIVVVVVKVEILLELKLNVPVPYHCQLLLNYVLVPGSRVVYPT